MCIAILLAASKEELQELVSVGELLEDIRIILVLPDTDRDTVANAHILRPRYLTYVDSDFSDVAAVLSKMLSNIHLDKRRGKNAMGSRFGGDIPCRL